MADIHWKYAITDKGKEYLDRNFGSGKVLRAGIEREERLLTLIETHGPMSLGDIMGALERQRDQKTRGELNWYVEGPQKTWDTALDSLIKKGMIE